MNGSPRKPKRRSVLVATDGGSSVVTDDDERGFFYHLCAYQAQLTALFSFCALFMLLSLASLVVVEPGTPTHAISVINVLSLLVFGSAFGVVVLVCRRKEY